MTSHSQSPPVALVLAAGFGRRLAPLTDELPKPLVPVGDRPLLQSLLEKLLEAGVPSTWVNVHHHSDKIISFCNHLGLKPQVSHELRILGTAGGARQVARAAGLEEMLLVNGDIWGPLPLDPLLRGAGAGLALAVVRPSRAAMAGGGAAATSGEASEGTVGFDREGRVVRLRGEIFGDETASGDYRGLAHLGRDCIDSLPVQGCLIGDWALPQLRRGRTDLVRAVPVSGEFLDVGTPQGYFLANRAWLREAVGSSPISGTLSAGPLPSFLGEGAWLAPGVAVAESVVGAGARVEGDGELRRCVVLPGARVRAPLRDTIVTPSGAWIRLAVLELAH